MVISVAFLETDEGETWFSMHLSNEDAMAKLREVAKAWKVELTKEPGRDTGVSQWHVGGYPLLSSWHSSQPPEREELVQVPRDPGGTLLSTYKMLAMKDARGGLSAEELAGDLIGVSVEETADRLRGLAERHVVDEVFPGRYRVPASARYSER